MYGRCCACADPLMGDFSNVGQLNNTVGTLARVMSAFGNARSVSTPEFRVALFTVPGPAYFNLTMQFEYMDMPTDVIDTLLYPPNDDPAALRSPMRLV